MPRPRRFDEEAFALKATGRRANSPPPSGGYGAGSYIPGGGYGYANRDGGQYDYRREVGRIDLNGVVRCGLAWIADNLATATLKVVTKVKEGERKGQWDEQLSHEANRTIRKPNPTQTWGRTIGLVGGCLKQDGNAYLIKVRSNDGVPRELWWVPNGSVNVVKGDDPRRPVARYEVSGTNGIRQDYDPADVVHIKDGEDPENTLVGLGRLKAQLRSIAAMNVGEDRLGAALRNLNATGFAAPKESAGGMGLGNGPVEEPELRTAQRLLQIGNSGANVGKVPFMDRPYDYIKTGYSLEELGMDTALDRPEAMICAAMGVNSLVLGLPSSAATRTYSNLAEARRHAWEDGIFPLQWIIAEALTHQWLYRWDDEAGEWVGEFGDKEGIELWWDNAEVPALREDLNERVTRAISKFEASGTTWDEFRTEIDLPPLGEPRGLMFKHEIGLEVASAMAELQPEPDGQGDGQDRQDQQDEQDDDPPEDEASPASDDEATSEAA